MVGLPSSIIKKYGVTKRAWQVFRGRKTRRPKPRSVKVMARRRYSRRPTRRARVRSWIRRRGRGKRKISIAVVGGLAGTALTPNVGHGAGTIGYLQAGQLDYALGNIVENLTGYDMQSGQWRMESLVRGITPLAAGVAVHMTVGRFANKYLSKVPYVNV